MSVFALVCVFGLQCVSELLFQFSYSFVYDEWALNDVTLSD